jgi:hypothetical protein
MNSVVLAISIAYVVLAVLVLVMGLTSRIAWWVKVPVIVIASAFFIQQFFATRSLLGWPGAGPLPRRFQVLWTRVVEPDRKLGDAGAIYLWVEELDDNNVPSGTPRSFQLRYSPPLADQSIRARDEIMAGNPQEGTAEGLENAEASEVGQAEPRSNQSNSAANRFEDGRIDGDAKLLQYAERVMFRPLTRPQPPPKD